MFMYVYAYMYVYMYMYMYMYVYMYVYMYCICVYMYVYMYLYMHMYFQPPPLSPVAPREVRVEVQSLEVHEGGSVLLWCLCKADPPATDYRWSYILQGRTVHLDMHRHAARIHNATRGMLVRCSARNPIGRGDSHPTPLDIQCKKLSTQESSSILLLFDKTRVRFHPATV